MHIFAFLAVFFVVLSDDAYPEETTKTGKSCGTETLVALQDGPTAFGGGGASTIGTNPQGTSFAGSALSELDQISHQDGNSTALEVCTLPAYGQRQGFALPRMWLSLDQMCRSFTPRTSGRLAMGRTVNDELIQEEAENTKPINASECQGRTQWPKERQRERSWQGERQKCRKRHWICVASALLQLPDLLNYHGTLDLRSVGIQQWRWGFSHTTAVNAEFQCIVGEQRIGGSPGTGLSGPRPDAQRCPRSTRPDKFPNGSVHHQGPARRSEQPGESKEDATGDLGSEACSQTSLDTAPSGFSRTLEQAASGVHPATSASGREGVQGGQRHPGRQQGDSGIESASGRGRKDHPYTGRACPTSSNGHPRQEGPGDIGLTEEAAEGLFKLSRSYRYQTQGHRGDCRFRGWRRGDTQKAEVHRTTFDYSNTWGESTRCDHVKQGRAPWCHSLNKGHRGPRCPFFSPLVEAYDDHGGRCAAGYGLEVAITFNSKDFVFPRLHCRPPLSGPWHDVELYVEELHAQREAAELHKSVMLDDSQFYSIDSWCAQLEAGKLAASLEDVYIDASFIDETQSRTTHAAYPPFVDGVCDSVIPHVFDRWCDDLLTGTDPSVDEPADSPEDDLLHLATPQHLEWRSPASGMQPIAHLLFRFVKDGRHEQRTSLAATAASSDVKYVVFRTYGFFGRFQGQRDLRIDLDAIHDWKQLIEVQWRDHLGPHRCHCIAVEPQPDDIGVHVHLIITTPGMIDEVLILVESSIDGGSPSKTVVECTLPSTGYVVARRADLPIHIDADYHFWLNGVHFLGSAILPAQQGQFWKIVVLEGPEALHLQQVELKIKEKSEIMGLSKIGKPALDSTILCRPPTTTTRLLDEVRTRAQERIRESQGVGQAPVQRQLPPHQGGANRLFPWHLWEQLFNERIETEDMQANLALYGLAIEPLETRYGWIRELSRPSILRMARLLFPEMTEWDMTLHLVTPQPQDPFEQVHILVEFLQENIQLGNMVPVLVDVRWFEASQLRREHRAAAYIATPTNKMALLDDLANSCQPEGEMICSVWTRGSPCLDFMTATLHRGDLVSIRILPQWTDEIAYGVSFSNGPAFYRFASIVTHQGSTRMINVVIHTPSGGVTTHQLRGFDTNTMRIIGTYADAVWGQQTAITFFEAPSGMRDGWHFGVSNLQSDATPLLIELVHQTDQGPLRQFSLALLLSGMSISQCIAYNTENHWHGVDFQRVILFNHRLIDEEQLYTTEAPPPGTLVTISSGDPGRPILPHGEPLPEVSSESDESVFGQYAMSYGDRLEVKNIQVSDSKQRDGQDDENGASLLQLSRPVDTESSKGESNGTAYIICNHILDSDATDVVSPRNRTALPVPVVTARPNQDLQVAMDEDIPYFHRDSQGHVYRGRIVPPPGWEVNPLFRSAWTTGAAFRNVQGALTIRIRSWCIKHGSPPERAFRDFSMRPQLLVHLQEAIRRIWRDKISAQDQTLMHQVRPTPMADADGARPMHFIIEVSRPQQCELQPVLMAFRQISPQGVSNDVRWVPALLPHPLTSTDVLRSGQVPCELHQLLVPLAGRVRRWMNPYHQRETTPGLFLPVWWDLRLRPLLPQPYHPDPTLDDDIEALNLMQTREASRSPRRTPSSLGTIDGGIMVHVFHMSNEHRLVSLDRTKPLTFIEQIEEIWVLPRHNRITELHQVSHPPGDLEATADTTFILETTANRNRQASPTDQLILFDLKITETGKPDLEVTIRKVLWARSRMTRNSLLHLVSAHSVCHDTENDCELWINNALWNEDGGAPRQVLHGDFLCLRIAGSPSTQATDIQLALCEQESADAQRFIFRPSPTPSPQGSPVASEQSESEKGCAEDEVIGSGIHLTEVITIEDENFNIFADPSEGRENPAGQVTAHLPLQNITNLLEPSIGAKNTDGTPVQPLSPRSHSKPNEEEGSESERRSRSRTRSISLLQTSAQRGSTPETPRSSFLRSQFGKPLLGSKSGFPNWLPGFQEAASWSPRSSFLKLARSLFFWLPELASRIGFLKL